MRNRLVCLPLLLACSTVWGQDQTNLNAILERLERLETQNRALAEEVADLKRQLTGASTAPPLEERLQVQENRTEELAQTKVQASQRMPLSITGMVLFNAFSNGRFNGANENPTIASLNAVPRTAGGTFRQTVLGFIFQSPTSVLGANVTGSLYMDFFAGASTNAAGDRLVANNLNRLARLRIASVELDWGSTSFLVGQEKPLISPREPNSLAQVGVSPLTNAGNPWLWQPQARLEHRFDINPQTSVVAQVGVFQTVEGGGGSVDDTVAATVESSRPGLQARVGLEKTLANDGHIEIASGLHASTTHVAGTSVPSRLYTLDWSISPIGRIIFSGLYFRGQNTAPLGTIRQGFTVLGPRQAAAVHSIGGWAQTSFQVTPRLTVNLFGGQHDDRERDLRTGIGKNFAYAGNAQFKLAPNVILGFEAMQVRTTYTGPRLRLNNHYDLALAYQF